MKQTRALALLAALSISFAVPASAQGDLVRMNQPAQDTDAKVYRGAAMVTGYDARQVITRNSGVMLTNGMTRKVAHVSREVKVEAGTHLFHDKDGWFCTQRDNYYAGGGRFGRMCFRDSDKDGRFERMRMKKDGPLGGGLLGMIKHKLDQPLGYSTLQAKSDLQPVGLKKALIYKGISGGRLLMDYIEYIKFESDPAVSRNVSVALPGGSGRVTVEGVTFDVIAAREHTIEYRIVAGKL